MPMNAQYRGPIEMPGVIPVFPLPGALLLPRGQMPLNIFEPRYIAMIDDSLRDGHRLVGMIQPDVAHTGSADKPQLYSLRAGRNEYESVQLVILSANQLEGLSPKFTEFKSNSGGKTFAPTHWQANKLGQVPGKVAARAPAPT